MKMKVMGCEAVSINRDTIDLRYVEQLTDSEQLLSLVLYPLCTEADHRWKKDAGRDCRGTGKDAGQRRAGSSERKWFKCAVYGNAEKTGDFACFNRFRGLEL